MKNSKYIFAGYCLLLAVLIGLPLSGICMPEEKTEKQALKHPDGPYVVYDEENNARIIIVNREGQIEETAYSLLPENSSLPVYSHEGDLLFEVSLHPVRKPEAIRKSREKTLVISDPHGEWEPFVSVLQRNGVIGGNHQWTFGKNELVIIGDVFDRGKDMLPVFWLIYKLEEEALKAGGVVTFLLGNHEEMVLRNNLRYTADKYKTLAAALDMEYSRLWDERSELGRWLHSKPLIQKIGNNLFVHAGLSREFLDRDLDPETVNRTVSETIFMNREQRREYSGLSAFIYGDLGPFWYRGMVKPDDRYPAVDPGTVDRILQRYGVDRIFVGHTIFEDVRTFFKGKVIAVNVDNKKNRERGKSRGVLIDRGTLFLVYDTKDPLLFGVSGF